MKIFSMTGHPSASPIPTSEQIRTKELLAQIAATLGVDPSVFTLPPVRDMEATEPSEGENARLILAFAKVADPRSRNRIVEVVEAQVRHAGGGRRNSED